MVIARAEEERSGLCLFGASTACDTCLFLLHTRHIVCYVEVQLLNVVTHTYIYTILPVLLK